MNFELYFIGNFEFYWEGGLRVCAERAVTQEGSLALRTQEGSLALGTQEGSLLFRVK